jgi:mRNA interferase MazF
LLARDEAYAMLTWVMVAPLTTTIRDIPTAVALEPRVDGVPQSCVVNLDSIQTIRKTWLDTPIARLSADRMRAVDRATHFALGLRD